MMAIGAAKKGLASFLASVDRARIQALLNDCDVLRHLIMNRLAVYFDLEFGAPKRPNVDCALRAFASDACTRYAGRSLLI
jgi:hypothetical protein